MSVEVGLEDPALSHHEGTQNKSIATTPLSYSTIAWTEAAGGALAGALADAALYGVDSAKVRSQTTPTTRSGGIRILFRGMGPTILLGSVPSLGGFFLLYAPLKQGLVEHNAAALLPLASAACAIPATIVGVPADVLKKRLVLGLDPTIASAVTRVMAANQGSIYKGLFAGWHVNLVRDIPFAGIKIGLYEVLVPYYIKHFQQQHTELSALGATACGFVSGVGCAILTAPLDVVNTRIKASDSHSAVSKVDPKDRQATTTRSTSIRTVATEIIQREGVTALFRGVLIRSFTLGVGSSIFWPIQRSTANYLQQW